MAINVLDVRGTFPGPRVRVPALRPVPASSTSAARRLPPAVAAAGLVGILEAVGLLAVAVSGITGVLTTVRPTGWVLAVGLGVLASWVVLCASGGVGLIEGNGRTMLMGLACAEIALVTGVLALGTALPSFTPPAGLPLPVLVVLVLAVPVVKLLLAATPSARQWVVSGPRVRVRRADPVAAHRMLATVTLAAIGLSLGALAVLVPAQGPDAGPGAAASSVVHGDD